MADGDPVSRLDIDHEFYSRFMTNTREENEGDKSFVCGIYPDCSVDKLRQRYPLAELLGRLVDPTDGPYHFWSTLGQLVDQAWLEMWLHYLRRGECKRLMNRAASYYHHWKAVEDPLELMFALRVAVIENYATDCRLKPLVSLTIDMHEVQTMRVKLKQLSEFFNHFTSGELPESYPKLRLVESISSWPGCPPFPVDSEQGEQLTELIHLLNRATALEPLILETLSIQWMGLLDKFSIWHAIMLVITRLSLLPEVSV